MVPLLAVITTDPELVLAVVSSASSTQGIVVLVCLLILIVITALFFVLGDLSLWTRLCSWLLQTQCYQQEFRLDGNRKWQTFTTFELGLLLLLLLLGVFSFACFLAAPVTTSNIVGMLFIRLKSRLLHYSNEVSQGMQ
jgi:amino acid transporter